LAGAVKQEDFKNILYGNNPEGKKLGIDKPGMKSEDRRAGNDYTFSAPKSVSVGVAAGVEGLREAHDQAVLAMAAHIEAQYSHIRNPEGVENAGNIVAAKFDHMLSRAEEPQLHSHLFVANMAQGEDGRWRANEPKQMFVDQLKLGELYRQELAHGLQQQGVKLEWTDREKLQFEVAGVSKEVRDQFSSRSQAIDKQVADWKKEGKYAGVTDAKLAEMAGLQTREAKDKSLTAEKVQEQWKEGFAAAGTTLEQVKNQIEAGKTLERSAENQKTAETVISQALGHLTEKEAVLTQAETLQAAARISGGQHTVEQLTAEIEKQAISQGRDEKGVERLTTPEMKELEARNVQELKDLPAFNPQASKVEVETWLNKLESPTDGSKAIKLSEGQRQSVMNELSGEKGLTTVQGDPGTGKTFSSAMVEKFNDEVLKPSGRGHFTINVAYTGKAAAEMSAASGRPSFTIDSFLNAYQAGKVVVGDSARSQAHAQATMSRAENTSTSAERQLSSLQSGGRSREHTTSGERHFEALGGNKVGVGTVTAAGFNENGFALKSSHAEKTVTNGTETHSKTTSGSIFKGLEAHETKSVSHGGQLLRETNVKGTVSRADGTKLSYEEKKWSSNALGWQKSTRTERSENSLKITQSTTWGRTTKGLTTTVNQNGTVLRTNWEGHRNIFGEFKLDKSSTKSSIDHRAASQLSSSLVYRAGVSLGLISPDKAIRSHNTTLGVVQGHGATERPLPIDGRPVQLPVEQSRGGGKPSLVIPSNAQVVLKIDEASFLGARQAEQLIRVVKDLQNKGLQAKIELVGDTKQMQSIAAGDFFRQAQGLAREGYGDSSEMKAINRQKDPELLKVAMKLNEGESKEELKANAREALHMLNDQGRITGVDKGQGKEGIVSAATASYLREVGKGSNDPEKAASGEKQSVLLVTATNSLRQQLNQSIRSAMVESGNVGEGKPFEVLSAASGGQTADKYKEGQVVCFKPGAAKNMGLEKISNGQIIGTDSTANTVTVAFESDGKPMERQLDAATLGREASIFDKEERNFAEGDKIVFLRNDKKLGVQNGLSGSISGLTNDGKATVAVEGRDVSVDLNRYQNIDHGYAVTVHKSQGATVESAIFVHDQAGGLANYNAFNVAATRETHNFEAITNDIAKFEKQIGGVQEKTTTVEPSAVGVADQQTPSSAEEKDTIGQAIDDLKEAVKSSIEGVTPDQEKAESNPIGQAIDELSQAVDSAKEEVRLGGEPEEGKEAEQEQQQEQQEQSMD
jgi:conjugative relaxase-like TrwC/TraI family protein